MILKKDVIQEEYDDQDSDEEDEENNEKPPKEDDPELPYQSEAFTVDAKARVLIYAYGRILKF